MAKRSEVALVIERLTQKRERIASDLALILRCDKESNAKVKNELDREFDGVSSAISLLESERKAANGDKPKRERKKKGATTPAQGEL